MTKRIIFSLIGILILLVIGGGFFWWWQGREIKGSPEDYVIKETPEGKFVENKKAGLKVKVPEGWEAKKMEVREGSVVIHTSEIEGKQYEGMVVPPLIKGCGIETAVGYKKMNLEEIKKEVKTIHWGLNIRSEEFEEITINNNPALKNSFDSENLGSAVVVYIPKGNKVYEFDLYFNPDEKEKCIQEFNKFLKTVSI